MSKDHLERRMYRKSPGRQYGYDYDPLRSQSGNGPKSNSGESASRSGTLLAHRPDPRRTRQLMRQSIIASKRPNEDEAEQLRFSDQDSYGAEEELVGSRAGRRHVLHRDKYAPKDYPSSEYRSHHPSRSGRSGSINLPPTSELLLPTDEAIYSADENEYGVDDWRDLAEVEQELGGVEPLEQRVRYPHAYDDYDDEPSIHPSRSVALRQPEPKSTRRLEPELSDRVYPDEDDKYDYAYEYEEDRSSVRRPKSSGKQKKLSRRRLLIGAGVVAVAGVGVAAVELPKVVPQAVDSVGTNVTHQVEDAFNRGVAQGAAQARKEFVSSMESIEGFTLEGAITAARLTRVAYDVFVSPIVKFGAAIAGDVLTGMLNAFKTARQLLAGIYQDNATLIAIQKVLESWVSQATTMPMQLDAITQSDLDGAQAYLSALQKKVAAEKAQLNATVTPVSAATPVSTSTPTVSKK